jgi:hypothetical protein
MGDEYSGSGHFVGESPAEPSAPAPAKKSSIQERKSKGVEVKDPNAEQVAKTATDTVNAMGPVDVPMGEVIGGLANQAWNTIKENPITSTLVGAGGLIAAWKALNNNKPPDDNTPPPKNKFDRTVAGRPANAKLGAPAPTLTEQVPTLTEAVPSAPVAQPAPTVATPPATFPAQATQQPLVSGYKPATGNLIEGAPNPIMGAAPAPADIAPEPVKPVDPLVQAKIDAINAEQRRKDTTHANDQRRADEIHELNKAKQAEQKIQNSQGKASSQTSVQEQVMAADKLSEKNKLANAVAAASKQPPTTVAAPVAPVATAPAVTTAATPAATPPAATPEVTPPATTTPAPTTTPTETPEQTAAKKEAVQKAVLGAGEKGAEPWLKGTLGGKNNPERATNLIEHLKSSLPEGQKLAFPVGEDGKSLGGMPSKQHVIKFTNDLMGTSMDEKAFKEFRFTEDNLKKMAQTLEEKIKNAPSPEAAKNLQKGFSTIAAMASAAGVTLAGLAIYGAYKKAQQGEYKEAAKLGIPAAAGLVSPAMGGLTGAAAEPHSYAEQLRRMSPILGTFAGIAQSKLDQSRNKAVPPPR